MQFTCEVNWTFGDFLFAGRVIGGAGLAYELAARTVSGNSYRAAVALAVTGADLILWMNGEVGIIGDEGNRTNLMFYGVVALGFIGAVITRARAAAMIWVMSAMALAQVSAGIVALGLDTTVIPITIFLTGLWVPAARLFHSAHGGTIAPPLRIGPRGAMSAS